MGTREDLVSAALAVLEQEGGRQFSTRAICDAAGVTAPTLYHHFGSADGLLSAAMAEAFTQFLESKRASVRSSDPVEALREGWDDYVRFAAQRPRLFAAMLARVLDGARIDAADEGSAMLEMRIEAVAAAGRLTLPSGEARDLVWGAANAAALLHAIAALHRTPPPSRRTVETMRETALAAISRPES